jgi:hypothetical protein
MELMQKIKSNLSSLIKIFCLFVLLPLSAYADTELYSYKLVDSQDKPLCTHMTKVFNKDFKAPWNIGYLGLNPNPVTKGKPLNQVFERLPGVEYNERFTFGMIYSKYPITPEFEAIHWREGRYCSRSGNLECDTMRPMLMAQFDIDNDGKQDWILKKSFMKDILSWESQHGLGDVLVIFQGDQFDPSLPIESKELWYGQKGNGPSRYLKDALLRPFVFESNAYIAAYQYKLVKKHKSDAFLLPSDEHMNILRVTKGSYHYGLETALRATTDSVCTIRMIPQTKFTK